MPIDITARWLTARLLLVCHFTYCTNTTNSARGWLAEKQSGTTVAVMGQMTVAAEPGQPGGPKRDENRTGG